MNKPAVRAEKKEEKIEFYENDSGLLIRANSFVSMQIEIMNVIEISPIQNILYNI